MKNLILCLGLMSLTSIVYARVISQKTVDLKLNLSRVTFYCGFWGELGSPVRMYLEVPQLKDITALNHRRDGKVSVMSSHGCLFDTPDQVVKAQMKVVLVEEKSSIEDYGCLHSLMEEVSLEILGQTYSHIQTLSLGRSGSNCRSGGMK